MNEFAAFGLGAGVVQGIIERAATRVLDAIGGEGVLSSPVDRWLRTVAARAGLQVAMLAALECTVEHTDLTAMPFFDPTLLGQPETVDLLAHLLLPAPQRPRVGLSAELMAIWRARFGDDRCADPAAMLPVAERFIAVFETELRLTEPFRVLLDSNTLHEAAAQLAAVVGAPQRSDDRHAERMSILARIEATLLWLQPVSGARPQRRRTLRVVGDVSEKRGEIGYLSQRPLFVEGVLYTGSREGAIHAVHLDDSTGKDWRCPLPVGYQMPEALALWRDFLVVAPQALDVLSPDKNLLLLDRRSGAIAARIPLPARQLSAPVLDRDLAYLTASDGMLYAVDLAARSVAWRRDLGMVYSPFPPALDRTLLLLPANDPILRVFDLERKELVWSFSAGRSADGPRSSFMATPVVDNDLVLASNWNGVLYALDRVTGQERWRYLPKPPLCARPLVHSPVVAGDKVLVGSYDHRIHAVDRRSGTLCWISPDLGRRIYSRPLVVGSGSQAQLYVTPDCQFLYALHVENGQMAWPEAFALEGRGRCDLLLAGDLLVAGGHRAEVDLVQMVAPTWSQSAADLLAAGNWPAAAFMLREEGRLAEAAALYKEHQLYYKAAILYRQAQDLRNAADAFAKDVYHTPSWRSAAHLYQELGELRHAATQYERLKEWDTAAWLWKQAGDRMRAASIYANQLGERRKAVELYKEELEACVCLHDYAGQANCLRELKEWQRAAELCLGQAEQREGPQLDDAARVEVARWYKEAANCFRNSGQRHNFLDCCKKARFYGRLPWLTLSFKVDKPLRCGASNLVSVVVANEGAGAAHEIVVSLQHASGCVRFSNFQPIDVLGPQQHEVRRAELRADEHGDLLVHVFVQWNDPDQKRREVQFPEWQAVIESPEDRHRSQTVVYVQGGTFIQDSEIYNGDVYRDQAQQTGDRVDIVRNTVPTVRAG